MDNPTSITGIADGAPHAPLDAMIEHWARLTPEAVAITDPANRDAFGAGPARTLSFAEVETLIGRLARSFQDNGLQTGDRIAIQLPNVWECPLTIIAAWRAGLVPCVFPMLWRRREIDAALEALAPRAIVTMSEFGGYACADVMRDAAAAQLSVRFILGIDSGVPDGVTPITDWLARADVTAPSPANAAASSGGTTGELIAWSASPSTGQPLLHSAEGLRQLGQAHADLLRLSSQDRLLNAYPFSSLTAIAGFLVPWLLTGARLVLHQPFDLEAFCDQLGQQEISFTAVPAPVIDALMRDDRLARSGGHLSSMACVWPMGLMVRHASEAPEPALPIFDMHNLEEFALVTRSRALGTDPNALPLGKFRLSEEAEAPVLLETRVRGCVSGGPQETNTLQGELLLRGASVARPLANGASDPQNARELISTGIDCIVREHEKARFHCTPTNAYIHHGGVTVSARELDELYTDYPDFLDAAAFAVDDPVMGQRIVVAAVPRPDTAPSLAEFKDFLIAKEIAPFKLPDQMVIAKTIPRGPDGAVERNRILGEL